MLKMLHVTSRSAVVAVAVTLSGGWSANAQFSQGPGLSSGSGSGTGAGGFSRLRGNDSGSISGVGPGEFGAGTIMRGRPVPNLPGAEASRRIVGFGPGVDVTYPNDPFLIPFMTMETPVAGAGDKAPIQVTDELLKNARLIATPGERSLALQRLANGAIAGGQFNLAHLTLEEAATAANQTTIPLMRDQRLIAIVTSLNFLSDALVRPPAENLRIGEPLPPEAKTPEALPKTPDRDVLLRMARLEWNRAVYLASKIDNPTYRNEMLYKVAESVATGSVTIANEYEKSLDLQTSLNPPTRPEPEKDKKFKKVADGLLVEAWKVAEKIDRLIWRYRAMVRIALAAADSDQYARAVELSRGIQNAEARAEAMLLLAEAECRHKQNDAATVTYDLAAQAVACVSQEGLRGVLAGFLIDSLIATGRFTDARACIGLYPETSQRLVALGAVAESQGKRGMADVARKWIGAEVPEEYRPTLYRRVTSGALMAIEQNRGRDRDSSVNPIDRMPLK